jgi:hypothetical protein
MSAKRFTLLSAARSGTSLVIRSLETHPDIWVAGEIFHNTPEWHLPPELTVPEQLQARETDPIGFVERVFKFSTSKKVVGFKMWYDQNPIAAEYVLRHNGIKKIILDRTNKLATYSSGFAAEKSGIWNVPAKDANNYVPAYVFFSEESFDGHVAHHARLFNLYRTISYGDVFYLTYSELTRSGCGSILDFLGLAQIEIKPQTHRLLSTKILDRFHPDARDRVVRHLTKIGKLEWLEAE